MACPLFGAKSLAKPVLSYSELDPEKQISMSFFNQTIKSLPMICILKCRMQNCGHIVEAEMC